MYELPLWRLLRQIRAIHTGRSEELRDYALAVRAAVNAGASDFQRYLATLGAVARVRAKPMQPADIARFGLAYRKET